MTAIYPLGFVAGALSTLSPCVLPLLPVILSAAARKGFAGPLALMAGVVFSFTAAGLAFVVFGAGAGVDRQTLRTGAAILLIVSGVLMFSTRLQTAFTSLFEPVMAGLKNRIALFDAGGLTGQAALGALLGVAWTPCAGPALGAAMGLSIQGGSPSATAGVMAAFAIGAATPLLALAYAGKYAMGRRNMLAGMAAYAKPAMGAAVTVMGLLIITGADKYAETALTAMMPEWLVDLTARF